MATGNAVLKRLLDAALILLLLSLLMFALIQAMPGDPIDALIAETPGLTSADIQALKEAHGVSQPFWQRYGAWLQGIVVGDWGHSRLYNQPVQDVLGAPFKVTATLAVSAFTLATLLAFAANYYLWRRPHGLGAQVIHFVATTSVAVPGFWLGLMLVIVFSIHLAWVPASLSGQAVDAGLFAAPAAWILPIVTLVFGLLGYYIRYIYVALQEVATQPVLVTAKAKGNGPFRCWARYAVPLAMKPIVTVLSMSTAGLLAGAVLTEIIFGAPGLGKLLYDALNYNDYNLAAVLVLLGSVFVILANAVADLFYVLFDPRVRLAD